MTTPAADPVALARDLLRCRSVTPAETSARIDPCAGVSDLSVMTRVITINARWDGEAGVWIATSVDVPGLVVEADTWPAMIEEVRLILPELLALSGHGDDDLSLTFRAEEHLATAAANDSLFPSP